MKNIFYIVTIVLLSACFGKMKESQPMYDKDLKSYNTGLISITNNDLFLNINNTVAQYDFNSNFQSIAYNPTKNYNSTISTCDSFLFFSNEYMLYTFLNKKQKIEFITDAPNFRGVVQECYKLDSFFVFFANLNDRYTIQNTYLEFSIYKLTYFPQTDKYNLLPINRFANSNFPQNAKSLTKMNDSLIFFHYQSDIYKINFRANNPQISSVYKFSENKNEISKMYSKGNNLFVSIENKIYTFLYTANTLNLIASIE